MEAEEASASPTGDENSSTHENKKDNVAEDEDMSKRMEALEVGQKLVDDLVTELQEQERVENQSMPQNDEDPQSKEDPGDAENAENVENVAEVASDEQVSSEVVAEPEVESEVVDASVDPAPYVPREPPREAPQEVLQPIQDAAESDVPADDATREASPPVEDQEVEAPADPMSKFKEIVLGPEEMAAQNLASAIGDFAASGVQASDSPVEPIDESPEDDPENEAPEQEIPDTDSSAQASSDLPAELPKEQTTESSHNASVDLQQELPDEPSEVIENEEAQSIHDVSSHNSVVEEPEVESHLEPAVEVPPAPVEKAPTPPSNPLPDLADEDQLTNEVVSNEEQEEEEEEEETFPVVLDEPTSLPPRPEVQTHSNPQPVPASKPREIHAVASELSNKMEQQDDGPTFDEIMEMEFDLEKTRELFPTPPQLSRKRTVLSPKRPGEREVYPLSEDSSRDVGMMTLPEFKATQLKNVVDQGTQTIVLGSNIELSRTTKTKIATTLGIPIQILYPELLMDSPPASEGIIAEDVPKIQATKKKKRESDSVRIAKILDDYKPQLKVLFDRYSNGLTNKIKLEALVRMLKDRRILRKLSLIPEITKAFHKSSFTSDKPESLSFDEFVQCITRLANDLLSRKKKTKYRTPESRVSLFLDRMHLHKLTTGDNGPNRNRPSKQNSKGSNQLGISKVISPTKLDRFTKDSLDYRLTEAELDTELDQLYKTGGFFSDASSVASRQSRVLTPPNKNLDPIRPRRTPTPPNRVSPARSNKSRRDVNMNALASAGSYEQNYQSSHIVAKTKHYSHHAVPDQHQAYHTSGNLEPVRPDPSHYNVPPPTHGHTHAHVTQKPRRSSLHGSNKSDSSSPMRRRNRQHQSPIVNHHSPHAQVNIYQQQQQHAVVQQPQNELYDPAGMYMQPPGYGYDSGQNYLSDNQSASNGWNSYNMYQETPELSDSHFVQNNVGNGYHGGPVVNNPSDFVYMNQTQPQQHVVASHAWDPVLESYDRAHNVLQTQLDELNTRERQLMHTIQKRQQNQMDRVYMHQNQHVPSETPPVPQQNQRARPVRNKRRTLKHTKRRK